MHGEGDMIEAESANGFDDDSAYAGSSSGSLTETLASRIARGVEEHGRTYAAYGNEGKFESFYRLACGSPELTWEWIEYGLPIDEEELDRIDMSHAKYVMLLEKKYFLAPIPAEPQSILDLGTGTGIWAINVADVYPSAEVLGLDIAPTQPQWVPPNCRFEIDDIEMPWTLEENSYDLIHARDLLLSVRDFPKLIKQSYDHIKPGGYLELQSVLPRLLCDDGTTPYDSGLMTFSRNALDASRIMGAPLDACDSYASQMADAGFEDIVEKRIKMPSSPWPKDKRLKLIGAFENHNLLSGISGMSLRMFNKAYGWSQAEIEMFLVPVRKDTADLRYHSYFEFVIVYGRKPSDRVVNTV